MATADSTKKGQKKTGGIVDPTNLHAKNRHQLNFQVDEQMHEEQARSPIERHPRKRPLVDLNNILDMYDLQRSLPPGELPLETRDLMLEHGWVEEAELNQISQTKPAGRRRWKLKGVVLGNRKYYRLEDILEKLASGIATGSAIKADEKRIKGAIA